MSVLDVFHLCINHRDSNDSILIFPCLCWQFPTRILSLPAKRRLRSPAAAARPCRIGCECKSAVMLQSCHGCTREEAWLLATLLSQPCAEASQRSERAERLVCLLPQQMQLQLFGMANQLIVTISRGYCTVCSQRWPGG